MYCFGEIGFAQLSEGLGEVGVLSPRKGTFDPLGVGFKGSWQVLIPVGLGVNCITKLGNGELKGKNSS